ncbi:MAG: META domain-containing protein [Phycisphaerales bacterium]
MKPMSSSILVCHALMLSVFVGCAGDSSADNTSRAPHSKALIVSLSDTSWRLIELRDADGTLLSIPERAPTLTFGSDDRVSGFGGVNRYFGSVALEGPDATSSKLDISRIGATRMAGSPELMRIESVFLTILEEADAFSGNNAGELTLSVRGAFRARFVPDPAP